jgi:manganese/iron transport system permease protein/iron/zinc/copper transport system permease protein
MEFLLEPLEYEFFRRALLAALLVGASGGMIGVYVVLRGMSYVGHGLSHAAIGGAVVGFTLNLNFCCNRYCDNSHVCFGRCNRE